MRPGSRKLRCGRGEIELFEQAFGFGKDLGSICAVEWPAEDALRGELGTAFGVATDDFHQHAGVDLRLGVELEQKKFAEDFLPVLLNLNALAIDLRDVDALGLQT